jgi:hypothetical protein
MATGLTGAPEPPPRRAGRTGRSSRQVAAPVVPPQGAGFASDTGQHGHAASASATAANTAVVAAVAAHKTATKEHYRAQAKRMVAAVTAAATKQAAAQQAEMDAAAAANAALRQRVADVEASGAGALAHEQRTRDRRVVDLQHQLHELQARHAQTQTDLTTCTASLQRANDDVANLNTQLRQLCRQRPRAPATPGVDREHVHGLCLPTHRPRRRQQQLRAADACAVRDHCGPRCPAATASARALGTRAVVVGS